MVTDFMERLKDYVTKTDMELRILHFRDDERKESDKKYANKDTERGMRWLIVTIGTAVIGTAVFTASKSFLETLGL